LRGAVHDHSLSDVGNIDVDNDMMLLGLGRGELILQEIVALGHTGFRKYWHLGVREQRASLQMWGQGLHDLGLNLLFALLVVSRRALLTAKQLVGEKRGIVAIPGADRGHREINHRLVLHGLVRRLHPESLGNPKFLVLVFELVDGRIEEDARRVSGLCF